MSLFHDVFWWLLITAAVVFVFRGGGIMNPFPQYLGDGVYASFNGFDIALHAPREDGDHYIVLKPETMEALQRYMKRINAMSAEEIEAGLQKAVTEPQI